MESRSCTVKIGSENMDSIYNVVIDNCVIKGSNRGLGIQNRDEGTVSNVVSLTSFWIASCGAMYGGARQNLFTLLLTLVPMEITRMPTGDSLKVRR